MENSEIEESTSSSLLPLWPGASLFNIVLGCLVVMCAALYYYTHSKSKGAAADDVNFQKFQSSYLLVYILAMGGDWLQGPHVWALYNSYGMTTLQIQVLFIAGFGSSMLFGTVVGSFADKYGRRNNCILYGLLYGAACITKHFANFSVLMIGRLLGGMATSILYSAFESWMVCEHFKRGFDGDLLSTVFSHAVLGNSVAAISAGLVAQFFADNFGYVAPFDVSLVVLLVMCAILATSWTENYGNPQGSILDNMKKATIAIRTDYKILCLGLIQSLFEGSMYTFVLEWTPALTPYHLRKVITHDDGSVTEEFNAQGSLPHGIIFASFMVAVMIGSSIFKILDKRFAVESFMRPVLFTAAASMVIPIFFPGHQLLTLLAFLAFEACVGVFWPSLGYMRGKYVPEETRSTIMNFFRVPLNLIVVTILCQTLFLTTIFSIISTFLVCAGLAQCWLFRLSPKSTEPKVGIPEDEERLVPNADDELKT